MVVLWLAHQAGVKATSRDNRAAANRLKNNVKIQKERNPERKKERTFKSLGFATIDSFCCLWKFSIGSSPSNL